MKYNEKYDRYLDNDFNVYYYDKYKDKAYHCDLVLSQAALAVCPEIDAVAHDDEAFFLVICCRYEVVCVQVQTRKFIFHLFFLPLLT